MTWTRSISSVTGRWVYQFLQQHDDLFYKEVHGCIQPICRTRIECHRKGIRTIVLLVQEDAMSSLKWTVFKLVGHWWNPSPAGCPVLGLFSSWTGQNNWKQFIRPWEYRSTTLQGHLFKMVGVTGFEPALSSPQTRSETSYRLHSDKNQSD